MDSNPSVARTLDLGKPSPKTPLTGIDEGLTRTSWADEVESEVKEMKRDSKVRSLAAVVAGDDKPLRNREIENGLGWTTLMEGMRTW